MERADVAVIGGGPAGAIAAKSAASHGAKTILFEKGVPREDRKNIGPDSTITLDFALNRLKNILNNMSVYPKKMLENLNITNGLIFSQRVMLELTNHGFSREKAYTIVQKNARNSWKKNITFYESLANDMLINNSISNKALKKMFDAKYHIKKVDLIFKRIFK